MEKDWHIKTTRDTGTIYIYEDGRYIEGRTYIEADVRRSLDSMYTKYNVELVIAEIKADTYIDRSDFKEQPNKINLKNGVLDIITGELESHNPDYNFLYKLDIAYNQYTDCTKIKKFMNEVTSNENDLRCLEEFIGYVLYENTQFRKFLVLHGSGNNGKSLFISIVRELVGKKNTTSISLQHLETDKFAPAGLYGKKLNMFSDLPNLGLKSTGMIKSLTGGTDQISAQEKFKPSFDFVNNAKFIFSANELPEVCDESDAFWNRVMLIQFPNVFIKETDNKNLFSELTTPDELSGFLNIAIKGLQRLLKNQAFTYSLDADETYELWQDLMQQNTSELDDFVFKWLETGDNDDWTEKQALYELYKMYCNTKTISAYSIQKFGRFMKKYSFVSDYRPLEEGKRIRAYRGVKVRKTVTSTVNNAVSSSNEKQIAELTFD